MSEPMNDIETDYSDIDMEELDSYLTSPPVRYVTPRATRAPLHRALVRRGARRRPRSRPRRFKIRSTHCGRFAATRGEASRANARVARVPFLPTTLTPPPPPPPPPSHPRPRR